jgi:putative membrane protein
LSSTPSSIDRPAPRERSATESLASRYRHLFVLPSSLTLLLIAFLLSFALTLLATSGGTNLVPYVAGPFLVVASSYGIRSLSVLSDRKTVATFRRALGVIIAGEALWMLVALCGFLASLALSSPRALANATVYGAFVCAGFGLIIIRGAFSRSYSLSTISASIFPGLSLAALWFAGAVTAADAVPLVSGLAAVAVMAAFVVLLGRRKTSRGFGALALFQSFMKTWTEQDASELEALIQEHSANATLTTKVLKFAHPDGDVFIILPGVHPGPFYPVGSYNFPGLLASKLGGATVLTLHRPGGHERNLATQAEAVRLAARIAQFASGMKTGTSPATIKGPLLAEAGGASEAAFAVGSDALVTTSFAPRGSDDLEPEVEAGLASIASSYGLEVSVVDAHNSISETTQHLDLGDDRWQRLFERLKSTAAGPLQLGFAHSKEISFEHGDDVTAGGITVALFDAAGEKWVLALADANNAAPPVREAAGKALAASGFKLMEICTSDSHDLAARGLTVTRGYHTLGEATPPQRIADAVVSLARAADSRKAQCRYGSGTTSDEASVFGEDALVEFAGLTQRSSSFARRYSGVAAVAAAALMLLCFTA